MMRAALVNCRTNVLIMVGQLFLPQKGRDLGMCIGGRGQGSFRPVPCLRQSVGDALRGIRKGLFIASESYSHIA